MIKADANNGRLEFEGQMPVILGELSWVIRTLYGHMEERYGKEFAQKMIVHAGNVALTDEVKIEEIILQINKTFNEEVQENEV